MLFDFRKIMTVALWICSIQILIGCQAISDPVDPVPTPQTRWQEIEAAGKIVVGTAADYPPFSYYNSNFRLDGFDVVLMQEIGRRLNVEVVFKDFAFEGLADALQLNQIDAAIAAITITRERQKKATFSQIYYVGEEAILTREDDALNNVRVANDMAGRRVGVQNGSVYEAWVQENLVNTQLIGPQQMFQYGDIEVAISDLKSNRIDLVLLDSAPAQFFMQDGGLKLASEGLVEQRFAIALPRNDDSVAAQLNRTLSELQNEGFVAQLAAQYLNINSETIIVPPLPVTPTATLVPTFTPPPTATTTPLPPTLTPTPPCVDGMAYIQDINLNDYGMTAPPVLSAVQGFTKGWRVQNTGTCPWNSSFSLRYIGGNTPAAQMSGQTITVGQSVPINGFHDFQVNLIAPAQPGTYQGFWQMHNSQGIPFGQRVWVGIQVPGVPTATPTQPADIINFFADRTTINLGESVLIQWQVEGVKAVYFYEHGQRWEEGGVVGQGSRRIWPQRSTTYELRVVKTDDSVEIGQIHINVQGPPTPTQTPVPERPVIYGFTVSSHSVRAGECVSLRWDVGGSVSTIRLVRGGAVLMNNAAQRQYNDCPNEPGDYTYILEVANNNDVARDRQFVSFKPRPQPR